MVRDRLAAMVEGFDEMVEGGFFAQVAMGG